MFNQITIKLNKKLFRTFGLFELHQTYCYEKKMY
jgi:hypothetical protein